MPGYDLDNHPDNFGSTLDVIAIGKAPSRNCCAIIAFVTHFADFTSKVSALAFDASFSKLSPADYRVGRYHRGQVRMARDQSRRPPCRLGGPRSGPE